MERINIPFVLFLGAAAALGGLLYGFDIAIITGAGPFLKQEFNLDDLSLGWAFSCLLFGCVIGTALAGRLTDIYGRRALLIWVAIAFALTSAATGLATTFTAFIIFRFLGGIAVGGISILSPMYVAEVSPPAIRGRMCTMYQMSIVIGILISYCINYALHDIGPWNWRWMFITGALPSLAFLLLLMKAPETPRFLYRKGRLDEAAAILERISGRECVEQQMAEIKASFSGDDVSWRELLKPGVRKPLGIGFILAILVHLSGVNTIIDYAPVIFKSAGFQMDAALFSTFIIGIVNLLFTLASFWIIDRFGRKPLYILGSLGMVVALALLSLAAMLGHFSGMLVLGLILAYIACFSACIGPVFWTLMPEIFPNRVRGTAMAVPVLTQWVANALVVLFFPLAFNSIGKASTFFFLAAMALAQLFFTLFFVPETKGKTLEEIETHFGGGEEHVEAVDATASPANLK